MITVILHNSVAEPELEEDQSPPESLVFPTPGRSDDPEVPMSCLSIIRRQHDGIVSMKIVLRNADAE